MKISDRLIKVASFISKGDICLDCGCDHAYVPIYLLEHNIVKTIYACDINEKPLKSAYNNLKEKNLLSKVKLYKASGLDKMPSVVNTVILSGLGATTIISILKNGDLTNIKKIITSSNNDYYLLRKEVTKMGYQIKDEKIVKEKDKYYPLIVFAKGKNKYNKKELKYGPVLKNKKDDIYLEYLKRRSIKNQIILNNLKGHLRKKYELNKEIREIEKLL